MKSYDSLLYKPCIDVKVVNEEEEKEAYDIWVLEGNVDGPGIHAQYKLTAGKYVEIVDGGTEEEPDPTRPIIKAVGVSYPLKVDNDCDFFDSKSRLDIVENEEEKKVEITLKNGWLPTSDIGINSGTIITYEENGQAKLQGFILVPLMSREQISRECCFDKEQFTFDKRSSPAIKINKKYVFDEIKKMKESNAVKL
jgi:hypothetical protein